MEKKNYKDDFTLLLHLYVKAESGEYVEIGFPTWDWRAKFYTTNKANAYEASYIGSVMHNCSNVDDKVQVIFDNHRLLAGVLRCEFISLIPSTEYADGNERIVVVGDLGVTLTKEPIQNDDKTISASIVVPFVTNLDVEQTFKQLSNSIDANTLSIGNLQVDVEHLKKDTLALQNLASETASNLESTTQLAFNTSKLLDQVSADGEQNKQEIVQLQELSSDCSQKIDAMQLVVDTHAEQIAQLQSEIAQLPNLVPNTLVVDDIGEITLGVGEPKVIARLLPESVVQNIMYFGDNNILRVDQKGNIYPIQEGIGTILVVPTLNTSLAKQIEVTVVQGATMLMTSANEGFHLTSDCLIRIQ